MKKHIPWLTILLLCAGAMQVPMSSSMSELDRTAAHSGEMSFL